jgi:hypothetical protein
MINFINLIKGLKIEHIEQVPLFERLYTPYRFGKIQVTRVYPDGSFYLLSIPREGDIDATTSRWYFISTLKSEGVIELNALLKSCLNNKANEIKNQKSLGFNIWRIACGNDIFELIENLTPSDDDSVFKRIKHVLNTKMKKIPKDN